MTRWTNDPGDAAFPDGERLHEAFAEEIERPGLEGPSLDAVLRSGTARVRRRRVTVGATFAMAGVAAVATATLATGGTSGGAASAGSAPTGTSAAAGTTPAAGARPSTPPHPADAVLTSGTIDGRHWQLVRRFTLTRQPPKDAPAAQAAPQGWTPQWCANLDVIVDGVQTNAGNGDAGCLDQKDGKPVPPANPAEPGFTSIAILDQHHDRLGTVVAGRISLTTASVTAQCSGSTPFPAKMSRPAGDSAAYYSLAFPHGSVCQTGTLSFFKASGSRIAFLTDVALGGGK